MAFTNSHKQIFSLLLASSFMVQSNLVCLAADNAIASTSNAAVPDQQATVTSASTRTEVTATTVPAEKAPATQELATAVGASTKPAITATAAPADQANAAASSASATAVGAAAEIASAAAPADKTDATAPSVPAIAAGPEDREDHSVLKSPLLLAAGQPVDGFVLSGGAQASPDEAPDKIDQLTKQILLKEIELERFNLNYTRQVAIQGRWKGWRYTGLQEVNGALGLTGAIISVAYRGARLEEAKHVKPCIQESANYIPMVGTYIGAGAAAMEFGINEIHDLVARHRGYGPSEAVAKVSGLKNEIDKMMAERDALTRIEATSAALSGQTQLDVAEGRVMEDMLNESLKEFERFHVGARRTIAFQQTQFFLDFSKYVLNGLGYQFAYLSLHDHHRRYNGNAGALFMASGGVFMGAPVVSRLVGKGWAELTRHDLEHAIGHGFKGGGSTLEADLASLDKISKQVRISNNNERRAVQATDRFAHYEDHQKTYTNEIRVAEKAKNKAVLTATENVGASLYVGGSKLASGICFGTCGFNHIYNAGSDSIEADRVTNDDLFVASVIAIPATAFSMLDSLRIQVQGEIARHKLAAKGELAGQIVTKRLAQLDTMEQRLKASSIK